MRTDNINVGEKNGNRSVRGYIFVLTSEVRIISFKNVKREGSKMSLPKRHYSIRFLTSRC